MSSRLVRHENATALTGQSEFRVIAPDGDYFEIEGDAAAFSAFWTFVGTARTREAVQQRLEEIDAAPLLEFLVEHGVLVEAEESSKESNELPYDHLLLVVTGSSFAHQTPMLCDTLRENVANHVDVILTKASKRFLSPYSFRHLADTCFEDHTDGNADIKTPHAALAERADVALVWPATAHTISKLAHGASSDLASTALLASDVPAIVAPAMNPNMWRSQPVQRNIALLREYGFYILEPVLSVFRRQLTDVGGPVGISETVTALLATANNLPRRKLALGMPPGEL